MATSTTGLAVVAAPVAAIIVVAGLFSLLLVYTWASFLLGAPLDGGAMQFIFFFVVAPVSLLVLTSVAVVLVFLLVVIYIAVGVLPLSVLVEFVFWRSGIRRLSLGDFVARILGFVAAGLFLGSVAGGAGLLLLQPERLLGVTVVFGGAISVSVCAEFLFGLVLTLLLVIQRGVLSLQVRLSKTERTA